MLWCIFITFCDEERDFQRLLNHFRLLGSDDYISNIYIYGTVFQVDEQDFWVVVMQWWGSDTSGWSWGQCTCRFLDTRPGGWFSVSLVLHLKFISPSCRIYASLDWIIIGFNNGLSPVQRQAIIKTNDVFSSITPQVTGFNENNIEINQFSLAKMHLKLSFANHFVRGMS